MAFRSAWHGNLLPSRASWSSKMMQALLPSFVGDAVFADRKTYRLHPTSYLDGLRGLASVLVFFCHYTEENHRYLIPAYGLNNDGNGPSAWIQLPFLRIIYSGRPMVHIFFVISGFALSYKPLKSMYARDLDTFCVALSSSTFRRAFRLFGPCIVSTLMVMCFMQFGWMGEPLPSWSEQMWDWMWNLFNSLTWPWLWDYDLRPDYDVHLWTIPIEFAHSMLLFTTLLMVCRLRSLIRQATVFAMCIYCLCCGKWAAFEFLAGLLLAERHIVRAARAKDWEGSESQLEAPAKRMCRSIFWEKMLPIFLIGLGLFVGGWPNDQPELTYGIRLFWAITPEPWASMDQGAQKFWFALCATGMVWSCGEMASIKRFLEGPFSQYCGRISYAVYICHGPVLDTFQSRVIGNPILAESGDSRVLGFQPAVPPAGIKGFVGVESTTQQTICWFLGLCVLGPAVIWAADLFWRFVDTPIVVMGRKMENAFLDESVCGSRVGAGGSTA